MRHLISDLIQLAKPPQLFHAGAVLIAHYVRLSCLPINNAGRLACGQGLGQALLPASVEAVEAVEVVAEVAEVAEVEQAEVEQAEVEQAEVEQAEVEVDSKVLGAHLYQPRPAAMI
jgi:hypothetical protein